jgi:hypothetical protein
MSAKEGLYRTPIGWRMLPVILGIFAAAGLVGLVVSTLGNGPPWWFLLLWFAVLGWLAFNALYRTSYELRFDDAYLFWRGFLRSGKFQVSDVVGVEYDFLGSVAVFTCRDGRRTRVVVLQGFAPFLAALAKAHPAIGAAPGRYARFVERAQLRRNTGRSASVDTSDREGDSQA